MVTLYTTGGLKKVFCSQVIEQIHSAPALYIAAAVEVVRRRAFSKHYLEKANALSHRFSSLHDEELTVRKNFQSKIK